MQTEASDELYDTRDITSYGIKLLWALFTLFIFYGALIPFDFIFSNQQVITQIENFNWVPFVDADGSRHSIPDIVQNVLFFIPFGFLGVLSFARNKFFAVFVVTFLGFIISLNVEILQLLTRDRNTSVTDLASNSIGAGLGAIAAFVVFGMFCLMMKSESFRRTFNNKFYYLFIIGFLVVAASSLQPFDFTLDVSTVWSGVKDAFMQPITLTYHLTDELVVGFRFFLFAVITSLWLRSVNNSVWPVAGILLSASIGVCLELAQFIVVSRTPTVQDLVVVITSCTLGGLFTLIVPKKVSPLIWIVPVIALTLISAAVQTLAPFEMRMQHVSMGMTPFLPYYNASTFTAIANFLEIVITYIPVGFVLQYAISSKRSAFFIIVIVVGTIAFGLEYAQGWIVGRYPDITDVIGAIIGATIAGSLCLRWSRVFLKDELSIKQVNGESKEILVT